MKYRKLMLTTLLAGSLTAVGFATATQAGSFCKDRHGKHAESMRHGEGHHDPLKKLMRHIDLSETQQSEIKAIIATSREATENTREQLRNSRSTLHDMATSENYNPDQARTLAYEQATLRADLTLARIDAMHRAHQVLTPEQQAEVMKMRAQRKERKDEAKERDDH